jgi:hypothetical protein
VDGEKAPQGQFEFKNLITESRDWHSGNDRFDPLRIELSGYTPIRTLLFLHYVSACWLLALIFPKREKKWVRHTSFCFALEIFLRNECAVETTGKSEDLSAK